MALRTHTFALADAVLSNGARLASAGGGLPQRVTTEIVRQLEISAQYNQVAFEANGTLWAPDFNNQWIKKYDLDGNVLATLVTAQQHMGALVENGRLYTANYGLNRIDEWNLATLALVRSFSTGAVKPRALAKAGTAPSGTIWWTEFSSSVAREVNMDTPAATGRTTGTLAFGPIEGDANGIWGFGIADHVRHVLHSDLANDKSFQRTTAQLSNGNDGEWFASQEGFLGVDSVGRVYFSSVIYGNVDRWTNAGVFDRRVLVGPWDRGGASQAATCQNGRMAFSPNGQHALVPVEIASHLNYGGWRVFRIGDQRAQWAKTFAFGARVASIVIPGQSANERDASKDLRKSRFYYSTNGVDFTEFTPGTPLSLSIANGATLTVRADMKVWESGGNGIAPYIGGDAGEGPTILWDDLTSAAEPITGTVSQPTTIVGTVG